MELLDRLRQVPLFASLSPDGLVKVGALFQEMTVPPGTYLSRQGELGSTFFLIDEGQAIVQQVDDKGYERPVDTLSADSSAPYYGITSLFLVAPRDATVIARTEMHLWVMHRRQFLQLLADEPSIERELNIPADIQRRREAPRFLWQEPGELLAFITHKHWIVFLQKMVWSTLIALGLSVLLIYASVRLALGLMMPALFIPIVVFYAVSFIWNLVDWRNDYYAVTNRRISYREHVAMLYDSRDDVTLDQVQNINVVRRLLGHLLGYGDVYIQTAAHGRSMRLRYVRDPEGLRKAIFDEQYRARATRQAIQRWEIRAALTHHVSLEQLSTGELGQPAIEQPDDRAIDQVDPQAPPPRPLSWLRRALDWVAGLELLPPIHEQTPERVVWRKHWLFLLTATFVPLVLFLALAGFTLAYFVSGGLPGTDSGGMVGVVSLGLTIITFGWLAYEYGDWGNDQYIVTNERIIDVEQRPLWLSVMTREASLGKIQNVHYEVPNLIASLFRYGDVVVRTAGEGDFTFAHVPRPAEVQNEIFRRINNYRLAQQEQEDEQQRRELATWFSVYDDIKSRRPAIHDLAEGEDDRLSPTIIDEDPGRTKL